jgi:hypothetical protein
MGVPEDASRKDQGRALLDGGSSPPPSDENGHEIIYAGALAVRGGKGTCKEPNRQVIHMAVR